MHADAMLGRRRHAMHARADADQLGAKARPAEPVARQQALARTGLESLGRVDRIHGLHLGSHGFAHYASIPAARLPPRRAAVIHSC
ncbi:hypothetical protein [Burkholderia gladioli]|uniref:hypothetical protein n=1 Tax=Burkholderia gladioli TaxID=28095 RepID=UPI001FC8250E|nr:hypothetical protein [Burkholderia gladioli]